MINMFLGIANYLLYLLSVIIIAQFVLSILVAFNVINTYNDFVRSIMIALDKMTAPLYAPIRKIMPDFGALDFSPMVVLIIINILQNYVLPTLKTYS